MFEVPGSGISAVHVTEEYVTGKNGPVYDRSADPTTTGSGTETTDEEDVNTSIRLKQ